MKKKVKKIVKKTIEEDCTRLLSYQFNWDEDQGDFVYEVMDISGTDDLLLHLSLEDVEKVKSDVKKMVELIVRRTFEIGYDRGKSDGKREALKPLKEAALTLMEALNG